jgi:hypothetical protein
MTGDDTEVVSLTVLNGLEAVRAVADLTTRPPSWPTKPATFSGDSTTTRSTTKRRSRPDDQPHLAWVTRPGNADAYEALLRDEIITGIEDRSVDGFREIQVFRRDLADEVEFITVMGFDSLDAVRAFAGEDHETSGVPVAARLLLARFDEQAQHYEVRERRPGARGIRKRRR